MGGHCYTEVDDEGRFTLGGHGYTGDADNDTAHTVQAHVLV